MLDDLLHADPIPDLDGLHEALVDRAARSDLLDVSYRTVDSPIGSLLLAATPAGLVRVAFDLEGHDQVLARLAAEVSPRILRSPARLDDTARQLDEYFAGERQAFDVPVDLQLAHGFRRTVLDHLRDIAYGTTASYAAVAAGIGQPGGGARGGLGLRPQPGAGGRALPPGGPQRRIDRPVPRRDRGQAVLLDLEAA